MNEKKRCAYCGKTVEEGSEQFCGKPCCEDCREKILLMNKVEDNKMLSSMNSRYIKYGIMKYGSLGVLLIALLVVLTADQAAPVHAGWIIAGISAATHIFSAVFRKKYKATMDLLLEEYRIQIHGMNRN